MQRQVEPTLDQVGEVVQHDQFHRQSRMTCDQFGQPQGQEQPTGHCGAQAHQPHRCLAVLAEFSLHRDGFFQDLPGVAEQDAAVVGQAEPSRRAMQQAHAEAGFQLADLARDGRLAGACLAGNRGKGAGLNHARKASQRFDKVHHFPVRGKRHLPDRSIIPEVKEAICCASSAGPVIPAQPSDWALQ